MQTLLDASRAGDPEARAILKAFGQEVFYAQHPEKRPLFTLPHSPTSGFGVSFFR